MAPFDDLAILGFKVIHSESLEKNFDLSIEKFSGKSIPLLCDVPNQVMVNYCGFRAIYSRDVDDLVACSNPFQNLGLSCNDYVEKSKRSHDDYSCGSGGELNEVGNLASKRPKMPVDPES
ncbi:hypothetical protein GH714_020455 [Hevea brasiliensis]|uniref:Uncharacterized protein n=1 Tax=Hevea brasiliensis TaxID=3981 RepID=A0A6A6NBD7_HEVBR|nr:hypothetical protein GH714_020455 [Hevea brasiliensis]